MDEIVLRAVDKADGHEAIERFRVTNNLPGAQAAAATIAQAATVLFATRRARAFPFSLVNAWQDIANQVLKILGWFTAL